MFKDTGFVAALLVAVLGGLNEVYCPKVPTLRLSHNSVREIQGLYQRPRPDPDLELAVSIATVLGYTGMLTTARAWIMYNRGDGTYIDHGMRVSDLLRIQREMYAVAANDECVGSTEVTGCTSCINIFKEYRKIPEAYKGACKNAYLADCHTWPNGQKMCSFYVKTYPAEIAPLEGEWWPLQACADGFPLEKLKEARRLKRQMTKQALSEITESLGTD